METYVYYPDTSSERYPRHIVEAATTFATLLFEPDRLGEVTHPGFQEFLAGENAPSLDGLEALKEYRYRFGYPLLDRVNFFAVPPSMARPHLRKPTRYDWDALMELNFRIPYESLMPQWQQWITDKDALVPVQLRMREPLEIRRLDEIDDRELTAPIGTWMVHGRSYWPYLINRLGLPHDQVAHVGEQVKHFGETGRPLYLNDRWTRTWIAYNELFDPKFIGDPTRV